MKQAILVGLLLPATAAAQPVTARFTLDLREVIRAGTFHPERGDSVGLRGDRLPLSWDRSLPATDADGDSLYEVTVRFPKGGGRLAYKIKLDRANDPENGWESDDDRTLRLDRPVVTIQRAFDSPLPPKPHTTVGTIRHHTIALTDSSRRDVWVYLPTGYERHPMRRYPTLYLQDGQNVFDQATASAGGEWHVDETAERLIRAGRVEPLIIVAVSHGGTARFDEYTPSRDKTIGATAAGPAVGPGIGGGGDRYGSWLVGTVKPLIDSLYRTKPEAASTGLGGSSLGGLVTMHLGLRRPDVFGRLLVVSPSVWWDRRAIVAEVDSARLGPTRPRIWLDIGTNEGSSGPKTVADTRALRDALVSRGWRLGDDLIYREIAGAAHTESAWSARFGRMLLALYPSKATDR